VQLIAGVQQVQLYNDTRENCKKKPIVACQLPTIAKIAHTEHDGSPTVAQSAIIAHFGQ
jgi:hypothetical protein